MTPAQQTAANIEAKVAATALGTELMQPMPPGWVRSIYEKGTTDFNFEVVMVSKNAPSKWPERSNYEQTAQGSHLATVHETCRNLAWAKHAKNTEAERKGKS